MIEKEINRDVIEIKVKEILSNKLGIEPEKIKAESNLINDLGIDSFGAVEFSFEIKDKFDINLTFEDLENIKSVQDVVQFISSKIT